MGGVRKRINRGGGDTPSAPNPTLRRCPRRRRPPPNCRPRPRPRASHRTLPPLHPTPSWPTPQRNRRPPQRTRHNLPRGWVFAHSTRRRRKEARRRAPGGLAERRTGLRSRRCDEGCAAVRLLSGKTKTPGQRLRDGGRRGRRLTAERCGPICETRRTREADLRGVSGSLGFLEEEEETRGA